jgi:hypothetical protein
MDTLLLLSTGIINVMCFIIGAKVGQQSAKGERIEIPNPVEAIKESREKRVADRENKKTRNRMETIMRNIDNYDGTTSNQRDIE